MGWRSILSLHGLRAATPGKICLTMPRPRGTI
jgi:hypothetical protein